MSKKVIVTGSSGLLGRAVSTYLPLDNDSKPIKYDVQRWVFSRMHGEKEKKVDIGDKDAVFKAVEEFKPDAIIHCAAIRAPDIVDKQTDFARKVNVTASQYLAEAAAQHHAKLVYISTDYVFDGNNPPYSETAQPNPLNEYGRQKLDGERAVLQHCPGAVILRVPILYGPVEYLGEGAVDVILKAILRSDTPCEMSHYERRYPTHVDDVAGAIRVLLDRHFEEGPVSAVQGVYHWSGDEQMTKYDMSQAMSEVFSLPIAHLKPTPDAPPTMSAVARPYNSQLSCQRLIDLGARNRYRFKQGIMAALYRKFVPNN